MKVEGSWPFARQDYDRLVQGIETHFSDYVKRLRLKLLKGMFTYVMEVKSSGKYVELRINVSAPLLQKAFDDSYLDSILEHERRHLDLVRHWEFTILQPPVYIHHLMGPNEYRRATLYLTDQLERQILDVFAIARMSDQGRTKYTEYLNLELLHSWNALPEVTCSGAYPKALWILPLARQEFLCKKTSVIPLPELESMKRVASPASDDQAFYAQTMTLLERVWKQATTEPPILDIKDATRTMHETLLRQKQFYIPKQ
jgi:hypothetical protein